MGVWEYGSMGVSDYGIFTWESIHDKRYTITRSTANRQPQAQPLTNHLPHLLFQFMPGKWNAHDLIITDGIHIILIPDDSDQLPVIEFGDQHFFEIPDDLPRFFGKGRI